MKQPKRNRHTENTAFILFDSSRITFKTNSNILKPTEFNIIKNVETLQAIAVQDITLFKKQALLELEIAKQEGLQRGLSEGLQKLTQSITQYENMANKLKTDMVNIICDLSLTAAEKILRVSLTNDPTLITNIVKAALEKLSASTKLTILVHPNDLKILEQNKPELAAITKDAVTFSIQASKSIAPGGAIIQTGEGVINVELPSLIERLESEFAIMKHRIEQNTNSAKNQSKNNIHSTTSTQPSS